MKKFWIAAFLLATSCRAQTIPEHLAKGIRSCEKRAWPTNPTCEGYALAMAHWYYLEHPDLFASPASASATITIESNNPPSPDQGQIIFGSDHPSLLVVAPAIKLPGYTPKPLQCGKYQHVEHWPGACGPVPCDQNGCSAVCLPPPPDKCVDDLHTVTEREWQDLMKRIEKLESKP
jgi:hypothetical protein